jgi:hypothetical protein
VVHQPHRDFRDACRPLVHPNPAECVNINQRQLLNVQVRLVSRIRWPEYLPAPKLCISVPKPAVADGFDFRYGLK